MKILHSILRTAPLFAFLLFSSSCRIIAGATALTVGVVALAGYTVYSAGELVVVTTGTAVSAGVGGVQAIVYSGGNLETEYPAELKTVYSTAYFVFQDMKFRQLNGKQDALSANLQAKTINNELVVLKLKQLEGQKTAISLKVGKTGDLKSSQIIYDKMFSILEENRKV